MKSIRSLLGAAILSGGFVASMIGQSCSTGSSTCGTSCSGCCGADGTCRPGTETTACGSSGALCAACGTGQTCSNGACGGPPDASSNACSSANCSGCCTSNGYCFTTTGPAACGVNGSACQVCGTGQTCNSSGQCSGGSCQGCLSGTACLAGTSPGACGSGGLACVTCGVGQTCSAGVCTGGCNGCVDNGGACQPGNTTGACGSAGGPCSACSAGQNCTAGNCTGGSCTTGCVDSTGACQSGTTTTYCGKNGALCSSCSGTQTCTNGSCVSGGGCTGCTGCCNSGSCIQLSNETTSQCGVNGQACFACSAGQKCTAVGTCQTVTVNDGGPNSLNCTARSGFATCGGATGCGVYRWSVKTGAGDSQSGSVNLNSITVTSIAALAALPAETPTTGNEPRGGGSGSWTAEYTVYELKDVLVTVVRPESDGDYHMVVSNGSGTMITEVPCPNCAIGSAFSGCISHPRVALETQFPQITQGTTVNPQSYATIVGIGFYDQPHEATGAAGNNLELHPVLAACFGQGCDPFSN